MIRNEDDVMKKIAIFAAAMLMMLSLAACGQKTELDIGDEMVRSGNCADAIPHLDATIAQPEQIMDMALAYFLKGKCAKDSGDIAGAYKNYYAAKKVACYAVAHETYTNLNTYGRSEYCQRIIPEMLAELEPQLGKDQVASIRAAVDKKLEDRYLKRFVKNYK